MCNNDLISHRLIIRNIITFVVPSDNDNIVMTIVIYDQYKV